MKSLLDWAGLLEGREYRNTFMQALRCLREGNKMEFKKYRKNGIAEMRLYVPGEDLTGISVNKEDTHELGGMIARNSKNHKDQWYVAKKFFEDNYVAVDGLCCEYAEFVYHISEHFDHQKDVICTVCGKTLEEITGS